MKPKHPVATLTQVLLRTVISILWALVIAAPLSAADPSATTLMGEALQLRSEGKTTKAIQKLNEALACAANESQRDLAQTMLGDCLLEAKRFSEAETIFRNMLETAPTSDQQAEARYRLAQVSAGRGNRQQMVRECRTIIRSFPKSPYAELARLLIGTDITLAAADPSNSTSEQTSGARRKKPSPRRRRADTRKKQAVAKPARVAGTPETKSEQRAVARSLTEARSVTSPETPSSRKTRTTQPGRFASLLTIPALEGTERDEMVTRILGLQDELKKVSGENRARVLCSLASATARFGELVEACRNYDRLLQEHPSSKHVETAYFEAIRLRAILCVQGAVNSWGQASLKTFKKSPHRQAVQFLMERTTTKAPHPRTADRPSLAKQKASTTKDRGRRPADSQGRPKTARAASPHSETQGKAALSPHIASLPQYRKAKSLMADHRFDAALVEYSALARKLPKTPQIWYELALVQVQLEKYPAAEQSLQNVLKLDEKNYEARSLLGYVHYQQQEYQKAAQDYDHAVETSKDSADEGLAFFDPKFAAQKMKKSQSGQSSARNRKRR